MLGDRYYAAGSFLYLLAIGNGAEALARAIAIREHGISISTMNRDGTFAYDDGTRTPGLKYGHLDEYGDPVFLGATSRAEATRIWKNRKR